MWILVVLVAIFFSLCDSDKKSCLSAIVIVLIILALIFGLNFIESVSESAFNISFLEILGKVIVAIPILFITGTIFYGLILAWIVEPIKRFRNKKAKEEIFSNYRCPHCKSENIDIMKYYEPHLKVNECKVHCKNCSGFWQF